MNKKTILSILISLAVIFAMAGIIYFMATSDRPVSTNIQDSSGIDQKMMSAIMGDGVIKLTGPEINGIADLLIKSSDRLKNRVKGIDVSISNGSIHISTIVVANNRDLSINLSAYPYMNNNSIYLKFTGIKVGILPIPSWAAIYAINKSMPGKVRTVNSNTIDIGNKLLTMDIGNISVEGDLVAIKLIEKAAEIKIDSSGSALIVNNSSSEADFGDTDNNKINNSDSTKTQVNATSGESAPSGAANNSNNNATTGQDDAKIAALRKTNGELSGVLTSVRSSEGQSWVGWVISINSKMISNPDTSFKGEINSAKSAYKALPANIKNEIKTAALRNMDVSAVRYLVNVYGI